MVLELDVVYFGHSFEVFFEADTSHELTYLDIHTFLGSF